MTVYIGFRVRRNGPVVTSASARSTARGSTVVPRRRNAVVDESSSPADAAAIAPAVARDSAVLADPRAISP